MSSRLYAVLVLGDAGAMAPQAVPVTVLIAYLALGAILAIGLVALIVRGDWQRARGLDKLIVLGVPFYAAPIAAFGTEHFTVAAGVASIIPEWIPWHPFWVALVGACFIAGALSLVTGILSRLTAALLAATFLLFVALMHAPGWAQNPGDRFALAVALRELSFSGGALALAASLGEQRGKRGARLLATVARFLVAIPVLVFSVEQFLRADHVPGIPLRAVTPDWLFGHSLWTYLAAAVYAIAGIPLLLGVKSRAAATALGLMVLLLELVVYVPIGIVELASLGDGFNYVADTLMFCGTLLLLAGAMPRDSGSRVSAAAR